MRRLLPLLLALLAAGLLASGCGDDEDGGDGGEAAPPAAETQERTQEPEPPAEEDGTGTGDRPRTPDETVEAAIENCKAGANAQPQLSDDVKSDLEEICEEAASGDEDAVRRATRDVCVKIVEESVPAGPAREQGIDACEQATQTR